MGKNLVTSYAALGVGLAIVLTFGLTAISSVVEPPSQSQFMVSEPESMQIVPAAPLTEAPPQPSETQEDVSAKAGAPAAVGGEISGETVMEKVPARQETTASYSIAAEVPSPNPFAGLFIALPYIAAAAVGSVVFVLTRKRIGW